MRPASMIQRRRLTTRALAVASAFVLAAVFGGPALPSPARATFPGENGDIVFASYRNTYHNVTRYLYLMKASGEVVTVFHATRDAFTPRWSPDGTTIAYSGGGVTLINADGSAPRVLSETAGLHGFGWSPDGTHLLVIDQVSDLWTVNVADGSVSRLTQTPSLKEWYAQYSPDGSSIFFMDSGEDLYRMAPDASGATRITTVALHSAGFDISPDGQQVVLTRWDGTTYHLWTMGIDGSNLVQLTSGPSRDDSPSWSPDGTRIVFSRSPEPASVADYDADIYLVDPTTGAVSRLTDDPAHDVDPAWGTPPVFVDIGTSPFKEDILWAYAAGITDGCGQQRFCTLDRVTRQQVASLLVRALGLTAGASTDYFSDDDGSMHEPNINGLRSANITRGCAATLYCPTNGVRRDAMAAFLSRALGLTAGGSIDAFDDDNGLQYEADINRLAYAGIVSGCGVRLYCPGRYVQRGEMAAFLHRAFG